MAKHQFTLDIAASDIKPGEVLLTFNRSDGEYIGVKLEGKALVDFCQALSRACTLAFADRVPGELVPLIETETRGE
jgi:hypothetical protein